MWIVALALRRPYTFTVMAIMIVLLGVVTMARMSTDIFPAIDIPVVSVIWSYPGVAPEEMAKRFSPFRERAMTTTVNDIEHIESQSYNGVAVIKVFFHEGAKVEAGVAQVTSICQTLLRIMPPGTTPPLIIQYSASNVPILQLGLSSKELSEQQLYDFGLNFIRTQLATVQGAQVPLPYGGKARQIMVDLDLEKLYAKGLSPADVSNALNAQNLILPSGTEKIGDREYNVRLNSSPRAWQALNDLPIRQVNGAMVYIRDVAQVRDGYAVQQNIVSQNRVRSALLTVLKSANASTHRHHQPGEGGAAGNPGGAAEVAGADAAFRPIGFRAGGDQRRVARRVDRGVPDGADDPALPGKLAQHAGGVDLHPALDPLLAHHHGSAGADAQHHDAGRPGAGGGHPGG